MIGRDYPALTEMLGAYFNQDFSEEYGSVEAAIEDFLRNRNLNTWVDDVRGELTRLLAEQRAEADLEDYVVRGAMSIDPGPITSFLERVLEMLEPRL